MRTSLDLPVPYPVGMNKHTNFEICDALIKMPDGSYSVWDLERQERIPWSDRFAVNPINARPNRLKICPLCLRRQAIAEFLYAESPILRTIVRTLPNGEEMAFSCANVQEYCKACDARYNPPTENIVGLFPEVVTP